MIPTTFITLEFLFAQHLPGFTVDRGERWVLRSDGVRGQAYLKARAEGSITFRFGRGWVPFIDVREVYRGTDREKAFAVDERRAA